MIRLWVLSSLKISNSKVSAATRVQFCQIGNKFIVYLRITTSSPNVYLVQFCGDKPKWGSNKVTKSVKHLPLVKAKPAKAPWEAHWITRLASRLTPSPSSRPATATTTTATTDSLQSESRTQRLMKRVARVARRYIVIDKITRRRQRHPSATTSTTTSSSQRHPQRHLLSDQVQSFGSIIELHGRCAISVERRLQFKSGQSSILIMCLFH